MTESFLLPARGPIYLILTTYRSRYSGERYLITNHLYPDLQPWQYGSSTCPSDTLSLVRFFFTALNRSLYQCYSLPSYLLPAHTLERLARGLLRSAKKNPVSCSQHPVGFLIPASQLPPPKSRQPRHLSGRFRRQRRRQEVKNPREEKRTQCPSAKMMTSMALAAVDWWSRGVVESWGPGALGRVVNGALYSVFYPCYKVHTALVQRGTDKSTKRYLSAFSVEKCNGRIPRIEKNFINTPIACRKRPPLTNGCVSQECHSAGVQSNSFF